MTEDVRWLAAHEEEGRVRFRIGTAGEHVVADWLGLATLRARRDGSDASLVFVEGAAGSQTEKIARGSARLLLRQLEGKLGLHGAAVGANGRAVVLLGRSGLGKSTLAAAWCRRPGRRLFADDAVAIDLDEARRDASVLAAERFHWLDAAARDALALEGTVALGDKGAVAAPEGRGSARLAAVVELTYVDDLDAPRLVPVLGVAALAALVPQVARFVLDDPSVQKRELAQLAALMAYVRGLRLERPRGFECIDQAVELVDRLLWAGDAPPEGAARGNEDDDAP